jgi:hypothetical protein
MYQSLYGTYTSAELRVVTGNGITLRDRVTVQRRLLFFCKLKSRKEWYSAIMRVWLGVLDKCTSGRTLAFANCLIMLILEMSCHGPSSAPIIQSVRRDP